MNLVTTLALVLLCAWSALAIPQHHRRTDIPDDDTIMRKVLRSCRFFFICCPLNAFATVESDYRSWDRDAVFASPAMRLYKAGFVSEEEEKDFFMEVFTCYSYEECWSDCGWPAVKDPIPIVKHFPRNAQDLLDLKLPELAAFAPHVEKYISTHGTAGPIVDNLSAEIEDMFDHITLNEDRFTELLAVQKFKKEQDQNRWRS